MAASRATRMTAHEPRSPPLPTANELDIGASSVSYLPTTPVTTTPVTTTLGNSGGGGGDVIEAVQQTLFGDIAESRVTFVIDSSGSMYPYADAVRTHVLEAVRQLCRLPQGYVNLVKFADSRVDTFTDKIVSSSRRGYEWLTCGAGVTVM